MLITSDLDFDAHRRKYVTEWNPTYSIGSTDSLTYPVNKPIHSRSPDTSYAHTLVLSGTECVSIRGRSYNMYCDDDPDYSVTKSACNNFGTSSERANVAIPSDDHLKDFFQPYTGGALSGRSCTRSTNKSIQGRHLDDSHTDTSDAKNVYICNNSGSNSNVLRDITVSFPDVPSSELIVNVAIHNVNLEDSYQNTFLSTSWSWGLLEGIKVALCVIVALLITIILREIIPFFSKRKSVFYVKMTKFCKLTGNS